MLKWNCEIEQKADYVIPNPKLALSLNGLYILFFARQKFSILSFTFKLEVV